MLGDDCCLRPGRLIGKKSTANKFAYDAFNWGQYIIAKYPAITKLNPTLSSEYVGKATYPHPLQFVAGPEPWRQFVLGALVDECSGASPASLAA